MPQYATKGAVRPGLNRMKGTGRQEKSKPGLKTSSTLFQFEKVEHGREDQVAEKRLSGGPGNNHNPEFAPIILENGEWWLQLKMDHPHTAIELIETYKRITGTPYCDIHYHFDIIDPEEVKKRHLMV
jgi:hypothetical protein